MGGRSGRTCGGRVGRGMGCFNAGRVGRWRRGRRRSCMRHGRRGRRWHRPMGGLGRRTHFAGRHGRGMRRFRYARRGGPFNGPRDGLTRPGRRYRGGYGSLPRALVGALRRGGRHSCRHGRVCHHGPTGLGGFGRRGVLRRPRRHGWVSGGHGGALRQSRVLRHLLRPTWCHDRCFGRARRRRSGAVPAWVWRMKLRCRRLDVLGRQYRLATLRKTPRPARLARYGRPMHSRLRRGAGPGCHDRSRPPRGGLRRNQGLRPGRRLHDPRHAFPDTDGVGGNDGDGPGQRQVGKMHPALRTRPGHAVGAEADPAGDGGGIAHMGDIHRNFFSGRSRSPDRGVLPAL